MQRAPGDPAGDRAPGQAGGEQLFVREEIVLTGREFGGGVSAAWP